MGNYRSLFAVAVIERILHDCKNNECDDKFPHHKIEHHEKNCKHRVVAACPFNRTCTKFVPLSRLLTHLETSRYCCNTRTPLVVIDGSKTTRVITLLPENLYGEKYAREKLLKALSTFKVTTYWYLSSRTIQNCCKRKWEKITKTHQQKWTG